MQSVSLISIDVGGKVFGGDPKAPYFGVIINSLREYF